MRSAELLPSCGHSFCAPCIASLPVHAGQSLCPLCRVPFTPGSAVPNWSLREDAEPQPPSKPKRSAEEAAKSTSKTPSPSKSQAPTDMPEEEAPAQRSLPAAPPVQTAEQLLADLQLAQRIAAGIDVSAPQPATSSSPTSSAPPPPAEEGNETDGDEPAAPPAPPPPVPVPTEKALLACRRIIGSPSFTAQVGLFVRQHCDNFELGGSDENKLEHTELHETFIALVDSELSQALAEELGKGFDMAAFLTAVPDFVRDLEGSAAGGKRAGGGGGEAAVDVTDDDIIGPDAEDGFSPAALPQTLEMLRRFTDFQAFKESMVEAKQAKENEKRRMDEGLAKYFGAFGPASSRGSVKKV